MDNTEKENTEMHVSGDDIVKFLRKIFRAGYSRKVIIKNENNAKVFSINLVILLLLFFIIPVLAFISLILLIVTNYSLNIEKRNS